ncbi:MAG: DUF1573 domain-containing protein [Bacteroidaceae bacterium]|nr:DUF1573 domain-containing protein [Bacteroidaceae bacterium]
MKRRIHTTLFLLGGFCAAVVAQPCFSPTASALSVGDILFQNPKTVAFDFENTGNAPLLITDVHPSCGCLTVDFPRQPIPAGQAGIITATYDAALMGTIYRELAVYTNVQAEPYYLSFRGRVVETATDYDDDFPIQLGTLRLSSNYVEYDNVQRGDQPVVELQVANVGDQPYVPQLMHLPEYLMAEYLPAKVQPGRTGRIRLTLDSNRLFLDGLNQTSIYLARKMGDQIGEQNEIVVSSVLLPAFRNLTAEQMARAPRMVMMDGGEALTSGETTVVMGTKKRVTKVLTLTNEGEEMLEISAVQVFNRALTVSLGERHIAPHKATKLKITVDAHELQRAKSGPRLLLITNDPHHAKTELSINVE